MKVLYGYFGKIVEHNLPYPGHPLYQLNLLDSLKNYFGGEATFDVLSYVDHPKSLFDISRVFIARNVREAMRAELVQKELVFNDALLLNIRDYDAVVLKHRFRNISRMRDVGLKDVMAYEFFLELAHQNHVPVFVIDSDFSIHQTFWARFPYVKILSFFDDTSVYPSLRVADKLSPTSDRLLQMIPVKDLSNSFCYDGNPYFKDSMLYAAIETMASKESVFLDTLLLGKGWTNSEFPSGLRISYFDRSERIDFYKSASDRGACTVNLTKPLYEEKQFVSPRIIEAFMLGMFPLVPSGYDFMPEDLRFKSMDELREKAFFFAEQYDRNLLVTYCIQMLSELEKRGFKGVSHHANS